jgi:hypothetical protein
MRVLAGVEVNDQPARLDHPEMPLGAVLPSLVTAKLAVYETMRGRGWSKVKLAKELGVPENSVRRLLDLRHSSQMGSRRRSIQRRYCANRYRFGVRYIKYLGHRPGTLCNTV